MLIYPDKVEEREDVCFVWLTGYIVAGCCHYLSTTLHLTPGGLCLRVCVRPCVLLCVCSLSRPPRAVLFFSLGWDCLSKIICFCLKVFHQGGGDNAALFPLGFCFISVWVCACVRARTRCMTCSLRLRRTSFCTDITSSLQSHTVFHSINFCPPPWAHFTGVNFSPPLGWVCGWAVRATVGAYWLNLNRKCGEDHPLRLSWRRGE